MKRVTARPECRRRNGGWLVPWDSLEEALKGADVFEHGGIEVGAKPVLRLVKTMRVGEACFLKATDRLEIATAYRPAKRGYYIQFKLVPGAWIPKPWMPNQPSVVVCLKPRKVKPSERG